MEIFQKSGKFSGVQFLPTKNLQPSVQIFSTHTKFSRSAYQIFLLQKLHISRHTRMTMAITLSGRRNNFAPTEKFTPFGGSALPVSPVTPRISCGSWVKAPPRGCRL